MQDDFLPSLAWRKGPPQHAADRPTARSKAYTQHILTCTSVNQMKEGLPRTFMRRAERLSGLKGCLVDASVSLHKSVEGR